MSIASAFDTIRDGYWLGKPDVLERVPDAIDEIDVAINEYDRVLTLIAEAHLREDMDLDAVREAFAGLVVLAQKALEATPDRTVARQGKREQVSTAEAHVRSLLAVNARLRERNETLTTNIRDCNARSRVLAEKVVEVEERNETLERLLVRVEPELVPHHDAADEVAAKFGLGPIGAVEFIAEIRAALAGSAGSEECTCETDEWTYFVECPRHRQERGDG